MSFILMNIRLIEHHRGWFLQLTMLQRPSWTVQSSVPNLS
ncbi:hypothetical protein Nmel_009862 [Mimus melanotis]